MLKVAFELDHSPSPSYPGTARVFVPVRGKGQNMPEINLAMKRCRFWQWGKAKDRPDCVITYLLP